MKPKNNVKDTKHTIFKVNNNKIYILIGQNE